MLRPPTLEEAQELFTRAYKSLGPSKILEGGLSTAFELEEGKPVAVFVLGEHVAVFDFENDLTQDTVVELNEWARSLDV